ncbi:hypothetical protein Tco_0150092 [Tanacetum coccineum]
MLKGAYSGAKTKTFEDYLILTNTPYPGKEIRRISANSSQENAFKQFPIRRIHLLPYAVSIKIIIQRYEDIIILGMNIILILNFERTPRDTPHYANLAEPSIESNVKYELGEELLKELRSNSYSERVEEDVVGHIAKILEILDPIEVTGMDPFQLGMMTFPLSLSGKARKWWMNEGDGKINTWEELVNRFFSKFYPLSCASNYDKMCEDDEEGLDPLEFITRRNSKFKDHKKFDEMTKRVLLYSWIEVGNNEGLMDEYISSDDDKDQTNSSMITKPEIKIGDEFLKILLDNSFNGTDGSDVTNHIARVLEITKWIKIPNMYKDELRLHVFSKSLIGDAKKWWNDEGTTTTWKELYDKFLDKYYPLSHTYKSNGLLLIFILAGIKIG